MNQVEALDIHCLEREKKKEKTNCLFSAQRTLDAQWLQWLASCQLF